MSSFQRLHYGRNDDNVEVATRAKMSYMVRLLALVLLILLSAAILCLGVWAIVLAGCQVPPALTLHHLHINNMAVYQDNTTTASPWRVDSRFVVKVLTKNRNTLAGCSTKLRTMSVAVTYRDEPILRQEVPLGFGLKPRGSRPVAMDLKAEHSQLKRQLAPVMEAELRSGNISLHFSFHTRYQRSDRKAIWMNLGCHVTVKSPADPSHKGRGLVRKECRVQ